MEWVRVLGDAVVLAVPVLVLGSIRHRQVRRRSRRRPAPAEVAAIEGDLLGDPERWVAEGEQVAEKEAAVEERAMIRSETPSGPRPRGPARIYYLIDRRRPT